MNISRTENYFFYEIKKFLNCASETTFLEVITFLVEVTSNPLTANPTKWSNTLKQFVDKLLTNCFSMFDLLFEVVAQRVKLSR